MDESKVFMFPDGGTKSNDMNSLLPLLMMNSGGFGNGS